MNDPSEHHDHIHPVAEEQVANFVAQQVGTLALCMYAIGRRDYVQAKLLLAEVTRNMPAAQFLLIQLTERERKRE